MPATYAVPPFSGRNYFQNSAKCEPGHMPCGICGRPVRTDGHKHWGIVIDGGGAWGTPASPEDAGHMGEYPVGNDCHARHVAHDTDGDAECTACGNRFWSATGHKRAPLCPRCK